MRSDGGGFGLIGLGEPAPGRFGPHSWNWNANGVDRDAYAHPTAQHDAEVKQGMRRFPQGISNPLGNL